MSGLRRPCSLCLLAALLSAGYAAAQQAATKPLVPRQASYAQVCGLRMYYRLYGHGRPLLLLHGGGMTTEESFAGQPAYFASSRMIVAPEQMGHGRTRDIDGPLDYVAMAEQTAELLGQLHISGADVLGWSDGGIVGLLLAVRHPDLVGRLAVSGASTRPVRDALTSQALAELEAWKPQENREGQARYARLFADSARHHPVFIGKLKDMWFHQPTERELGTAALAKITAPTLVIAGDQDAIRLEHTLDLYHAIPKAQLLIVPGTGHDTVVKRAAWLNPILQTFFDEPRP
jgi:pimeloyl-ACP methyl ester carboxylesterase